MMILLKGYNGPIRLARTRHGQGLRAIGNRLLRRIAAFVQHGIIAAYGQKSVQ